MQEKGRKNRCLRKRSDCDFQPFLSGGRYQRLMGTEKIDAAGDCDIVRKTTELLLKDQPDISC